MGFTRENLGFDFEIPVSDVQAYRQFGNSVVVPQFQAGSPTGSMERAGTAVRAADGSRPGPMGSRRWLTRAPTAYRSSQVRSGARHEGKACARRRHLPTLAPRCGPTAQPQGSRVRFRKELFARGVRGYRVSDSTLPGRP